MDYAELLEHLREAEYRRIERDDRLLDVFPLEAREKGVELWEYWSEHEVHLLRVRLPYDAKKLKLYALARAQFEKLLLNNETADLANFELIAEGSAAAEHLVL